jgi:hypothetical protein
MIHGLLMSTPCEIFWPLVLYFLFTGIFMAIFMLAGLFVSLMKWISGCN